MSTKLSEDQLKSLANQLSHPSGEQGIAVAAQMHESNFSMTQKSIQLLDLKPSQRVLELGHGNGSHVNFLMQQADDLHYTGLEISSLMNEEAAKINQGYVTKNKATFKLYDGQSIPFTDHSFDAIFTVNTIYFWQQPSLLIQELNRVLSKNDKLVIGFVQKEFMARLPFTQHGFELYDTKKVDDLVTREGFIKIQSKDYTESVEVKSGGVLDRPFTIAAYSRS